MVANDRRAICQDSARRKALYLGPLMPPPAAVSRTLTEGIAPSRP